jgi:zinc/manganese transport system permease protein
MLTPSWDPIADWQTIWQYPFMRHAFIAGTVIAVMAAVAGYFVVLRGLAFASHTLANVGFAGAAGAVALGANPALGLLGFTLAAALGMGALGKRIYGRDVAVGIVLAVSLGLGFLFIYLYKGYSTDAYAILFGEVLGISAGEVVVALVTGGLTLVALAALYRPLLFATVDEEVAEAKGLRVRLLSGAFLVVLALAVAEAVQIVGVLLIFALLVTPAATAERLTARPERALALAVALALLATWGGLAVAFYAPYPLGFFITTISFAFYLLARLYGAWRSTSRRRGRRGTHAAGTQHAGTLPAAPEGGMA